MLKTYKYRIYPNKQQKELLAKHFGCARFVYNWGLNKKNEEYQATGKTLSCFDLIKELVELKINNPWLKEVNSQSLQMSLRNLDNAFTNFFKKRGNFPKFKKKKSTQSAQFVQYNRAEFDSCRLYIMKFKEGIKTKFHRNFTGKIKTVTISQVASGKYFASILVENGKELPLKETFSYDNSVGVDLGIKDFAVLSNGEKIKGPKSLIKLEKRIKVAQKVLSRKQKGSSNRKKTRKRLSILYEKVTNQRNDFLHKLSSRLINENQAICIEDLNVSGLLKNHKLAKHIADSGWSTFRQFLEYKAEWYGKNILTIGRFEPSSKMCECGHINNNLKLSDRTWTCEKCKQFHDRDILAANNIKKFAFVPLERRNLKPLEKV